MMTASSLTDDVTALALLIPEAEPVWGPYRARHDPSAAVGMPAHITVIYPFMPPGDVAAEVTTRIGAIAAANETMTLSFHRIGAFDNATLFLIPDPAEPVRDLTVALWQAFPDFPPYGGLHDEIVRHLTIGHFEDAESFDAVATEAETEAKNTLPIHSVVARLRLMQRTDGEWRERSSFDLGPIGRSRKGTR